MTRFLKRCWLFLAILIISTALMSSAFRALTPFAKHYKRELENQLSILLGEPVFIKTMETDWYWFRPVVKLEDIQVQNGLKLDKLLVGINLFSSLLHWQLRPGILVIDDLHLNLRQQGKDWQIEGYHSENKIIDKETYQAALSLILSQQNIIIRHLSSNVYFEDGNELVLKDLNLRLANKNGFYKLKGKGLIEKQKLTEFAIDAIFNLDDFELQKAKGKFFFAVKNFMPEQWQNFLPQTQFKFKEGSFDLNLWADIKKGQFNSVQAHVDLHDFLIEDSQSKQNEYFPDLNLNLAWQTKSSGWQLTADKINMYFQGKSFPQNSFSLHFDKTNNAYIAYLNHFVFDLLDNSPLRYVDCLKPLLALSPKGQLENTQLEIKNNQLSSFLTRFNQLSFNFPSMKTELENLNGVLFWTPTEGKLSLDSDKAALQISKKKKILFDQFSALFNWQKKAESYDVQVEQIILLNPHLNFKAKGIVSHLDKERQENVSFQGNIKADHAEYWLQYVPDRGLKPKLRDWLKKDIKRIKSANIEFNLEGPLHAFPFDEESGVFNIKAQLDGVDLFFAHNWPLTTDIAGLLTVDKRKLETAVFKANFNGIPLKEAHLSIDDLGLDKETLLLHSISEAESEKALNYIKASPLNKKLHSLNMLTMKGPLSLDLQLEVPLYPQNDTILAAGEMQFKEDEVIVHHSMDEIQLEKLNGHLSFNEKGVLDSDLQGFLLNSPVAMKIRSVHTATPYTEVKTKGKVTIETLNKKFKHPLFNVMKGTLGLESVLQLTDNPDDLDKLVLSTNLEGVEIALPEPLAKKAEDIHPLHILLAFNPAKALNLNVNYDKKLSADLWFNGAKDSFKLNKGELLIGREGAKATKEGLQIKGEFSAFNLDEWLELKNKLAEKNNQENSIFKAINLIDLKLNKANITDQNYSNLLFLGEKLNDNEWSFHLDEQKIKANLSYNSQTNSLRGQFDRLYLLKRKEGSVKEENNLKPADLPSIDFRINHFHYSDFNLGSINLIGKSKPNLWQIESCKIKAPFYEFDITGQWTNLNDKDETQLKVNLQISDLGKSLKRWHISPAVKADRGELRFEGGWQDSLLKFALKKVKGQMALSLKDGRITNLSPETEEKLGLGKLLSVLSLQTIPRRLKLDFSDLANDGYSFDDFKGSFSLANGIIQTDDSYIEGPVAYASMKGNLNIIEKLYDVELKVSPHITASLPVVATIAGGPIAGFATWVASRIINQGMQKISAYTYKISGPWQKPKVQQVSIIKKLKDSL